MSANIRLTQWATCAGCAAKMGTVTLGELLRHLSPLRDPNLLVGRQTSVVWTAAKAMRR